ncbi:hypothetical protein [Kitasatospora sp. McL0602]|uniref:hypothetical protein n=1 Tax=Kitasatospora sp. McL0602 TaxID=3439530 RepID=UPI003F8C14A1
MKQPEPSADGSVLSGIVEAARDGDGRVVHRLPARLSEQATVADLYALRDALGPHTGSSTGPGQTMPQ